MSEPFAYKTVAGAVQVDAMTDARFKAELKRLAPRAPVDIHRMIDRALREGPNPDNAHAFRYFGKELPEIVEAVTPLITSIQSHFAWRLKLPGFSTWLRITGYGNDYRMIMAMRAWAGMKKDG